MTDSPANSLASPSTGFDTPTRKRTNMRTNMRTDKATVAAWAMWDWGSAAFNAVLVTFIFSVYLTDSVGKQIDSQFTPAQWLSWSMTVAGLVIFAVTPVMGQRSDRLGRRRRALGFWSLMTFLAMAALAFIRNDAPVYFWLGLLGLAVGSVTIQFAEVNYFAQLNQVAEEDKVGRVSGLGWSAGYFGGIVLLLICYFGFVSGDGGALGLSTEGGFNMRMVALLAAIWFGVSALPVLFRVPEITPSGGAAGGVVDSYKELFRTLRDLWQVDRNAVYFLSPPPYSATDCPRCLVLVPCSAYPSMGFCLATSSSSALPPTSPLHWVR